jgi:hypothetical protein
VAGNNTLKIGNSNVGTAAYDGLISKVKVVEGILDLATISQEWSSTRQEIN